MPNCKNPRCKQPITWNKSFFDRVPQVTLKVFDEEKEWKELDEGQREIVKKIILKEGIAMKLNLDGSDHHCSKKTQSQNHSNNSNHPKDSLFPSNLLSKALQEYEMTESAFLKFFKSISPRSQQDIIEKFRTKNNSSKSPKGNSNLNKRLALLKSIYNELAGFLDQFSKQIDLLEGDIREIQG